MFVVTYERRKPSRNRNSGVKGASVKKKTCCVPVQVLFESIKRKSLTSFMVSFFPWSGKHAKGHIKHRTSGVWCTHRTCCCPILHFIWWYCCHRNWGAGGKRVWVMIREFICEKIISSLHVNVKRDYYCWFVSGGWWWPFSGHSNAKCLGASLSDVIGRNNKPRLSLSQKATGLCHQPETHWN